jgi:glycosyltransferase involved in cell wall biosynthesis
MTKPDIIYLHSSRAGFYGRILPHRVPIYYSSHGFAFQRRDVNSCLRAFYFAIEKILKYRTNKYVSIWPIDHYLATNKLRYGKTVFYRLHLLRKLEQLNLDKFTVSKGAGFAILGRISEAKDPKFASSLARKIGNSADIYWIGAYGRNNQLAIEDLSSSGVRILDWVTPAELEQEIRRFYAVIITSLWESGPLVFYEALYSGVPIISRSLPAVDILGIETFPNVESLSLEISAFSNSPEYRRIRFQEQISNVKSYLAGLPDTELFV